MKKFLNFETMITPVLIKILYPVLSILGILGYFTVSGAMVDAMGYYFRRGGGKVFFIYLFNLIGFLAYLLILRVIAEQIMVFFSIHKNVFKLANPNEKAPDSIDNLGELKKELNINTKPKPQPQNFQNQGYQQPPYNQPNQYYGGQPNQFQQQPQQNFQNQPYPQQGFQNQTVQNNQQPTQPTQPTQPQAPQPQAPQPPIQPQDTNTNVNNQNKENN